MTGMPALTSKVPLQPLLATNLPMLGYSLFDMGRIQAHSPSHLRLQNESNSQVVKTLAASTGIVYLPTTEKRVPNLKHLEQGLPPKSAADLSGAKKYTTSSWLPPLMPGLETGL